MMINIEDTTRRLYLPTSLPERAGAAFWFGSTVLDGVRHAGELFQAGKIDYVILTGGYNDRLQDREALAGRSILLADFMIPDDLLITEANSKNSHQNVFFIMATLTLRVGLGNLQDIVVIAVWWHLPRAIMTLAAAFPSGTRFWACNVITPECTPENWHENPEMLVRIPEEFPRHIEYLAKGHIAPIELVDRYYIRKVG